MRKAKKMPAKPSKLILQIKKISLNNIYPGNLFMR